jgi:hypothetical protein
MLPRAFVGCKRFLGRRIVASLQSTAENALIVT